MLDIETEIEELKSENEYLREKLKIAEDKLRNALVKIQTVRALVMS